MSEPRVLVVEDEWLIAEASAEILGSTGYHVVGPFSTVADALRLLSNESVDAALLDMQLDRETSLPVADALRERHIPFAFLTGFDRRRVPPRFACAMILQKPLPPRALREAIGKLLDAGAMKSA